MKRGLCTEKEEEECKEKHGEYYEWTCKECSKKKRADLHPYTEKLLRNHLLQSAGFPLSADDLGYEEWFDFARIHQVLNPPHVCPFIGGKKAK